MSFTQHHPELLLLFSSNWETLYAQNAIDLLAAPSGSLVQFRYLRSWLAPSLEARLEHPGSIDGMPVLCLFVDRTIHSDIGIVVPTRFGRVISVESHGDVWHFFFTVHDYFSYEKLNQHAFGPDRSTVDKASRAREWVTYFRKALATALNGGTRYRTRLIGPPDTWASFFKENSNSRLIYRGDSSSATKDWQSVVFVLHQLPYFTNTVFFRVTAIHVLTERWGWLDELSPIGLFRSWLKPQATEIPQQDLATQVRGYIMDRCHPYQISIFVCSGKDLSTYVRNYQLLLNYEKVTFIGESVTIPISAKNDVHRLLLFPVFGTADSITSVSVSIAAPESDSAAPAPESLQDDRTEHQTPEAKVWLTEDDLLWMRERCSGTALKKTVRASLSAPAGPKLRLLFKSQHSKRYLRIGGLFLFLGFMLQFAITEDALRQAARQFPEAASALHQYGIRAWNTTILIKLVSIYCLYKAFVVTTRKLPSAK